jgi:hypothetical protein
MVTVCSALSGSTGRSEIRLLLIFGVEREAVILVAGDKAVPGRTKNEEES